MNNLRLQGHFEAKPRFSNKLPALYLDSRHDSADAYHVEVYLVNNTGQTMDFVASPNSLLSNSSLAQAPTRDGMLYYEHVSSGEAVKVADFDEIFDSDFLHQLHLSWQHHAGPPRSTSIIDKGIKKFRYHVLEWHEDV